MINKRQTAMLNARPAILIKEKDLFFLKCRSAVMI